MLETKRLILRPWQEADAPALYEYAKDPEVGPPAGWPPHTSVENSREIIRDVLSAPETYAVCLRDGRPIGSIGLMMKNVTTMTDRDDECELGYWIAKPYWGQGLIPEAARELLRYAFEELNMQAVWCGYYEGNEKSRRVQKKLGFVYRYTTENLDVKQLNEKRTGHTNLLTKQRWQMLHGDYAQSVYTYLQSVPKGKVVTYGQIAAHMGNKKMARVVGNILHSNPDPASIPCHRVVNSKGQVAENYAFGGASVQRKRLEAEGIVFESNGTVNLKKYGM